MVREYTENKTSARFLMHSGNKLLKGNGLNHKNSYPVNTFIFNKGEAQEVLIDSIQYIMPANSILPLVSNQHFVFKNPESITAWQFNREFYCIIDHDAEVGCVGFIFYGIKHPMFIQMNQDDINDISELEKNLSNELKINDNFQGEMLRTLLKRLIIKVTRLAKQQNESYLEFPDEKMDIVRKFSLILEQNFKKEHSVSFYADLLNKSPKTLSNVFSLLKQSTPSNLIRDRIILEAKRYLHYTEKTAKEIAYELGFENPAHFSRFFKQYTGKKISDFKTFKH